MPAWGAFCLVLWLLVAAEAPPEPVRRCHGAGKDVGVSGHSSRQVL